MYTREEREGILWEFHRSGMNVRQACDTLPLFPARRLLGLWLRMEAASELVAREMPDRVRRMHCTHGEGSPAFAARARGRIAPKAGERRRGPTLADTGRHAGQTDWRDWGRDLPEDPGERARMAEVKLAEALAVLDVLKAPGPGSLTSEERYLAGNGRHGLAPAVLLSHRIDTVHAGHSFWASPVATDARQSLPLAGWSACP